VFGVAGLWERSRRADGSCLLSCTLITVPANQLLAAVHNEKPRMPAILAASEYHEWLSAPAPQARALLQPYSAATMRAWKVSRRVNDPRLPDDERLIEPL